MAKSSRRKQNKNKNRKSLRTSPRASSVAARGNGATPRAVRAAARLSPENWRAPAWYVILLAIFIGSPTLLGTYGHNYGYSPDLHMASVIQVGGVGILALFFLTQAQRSFLYVRRMPVMTPAVLLLAWATLSLFWAHNHYEATIKLLDWGGAVLGGLLLVHTLGEERHARWAVLGVFLSGCMLLVIGLAQYWFNVEWVDQHARPAITFNNKNMAAQYMLLVMPLGFALAMYRRFPIWWRIFCVLISLGIIYFVLVSNTRGAIIATMLQIVLLAVTFTGLVLYSRAHVQWKYVLPGILLLLLVLFFSMTFSNYGLIEGWGKVYSRISAVIERIILFQGEVRFAIWSNTLEMIRDNPILGVGIGNWVVEYPIYHQRIMVDHQMTMSIQHINTHQDYLEIVSELGLIGFACIFMIGVQVIRIFWKMARLMDGDDSYIAAALVCGLAGLAVNALGSFPFQQPAPVFVFMCYLGLLDFYWNRAKGAPPLARLPIRQAALPSAVAAGVLCLALVMLHYAWYQSEIHFRRATIASRANEEQQMILEAEESLRWSPGRQRMSNFIAMGKLRRGENEQAARAFDNVLGAYPHLIHTLGNASMAYNRLGMREKTLLTLQHLIDIRPSPMSYMRMGAFLYGIGQRDASLDYLRKSLGDGWPPLSKEYEGQVRRLLRRVENVKRVEQGEKAIPYVLDPAK